MPMGFMMANQQNPQLSADQKGAADKNINPLNKVPDPKKVESNKKEEKNDVFPPPVNTPATTNDALSAQKLNTNSNNNSNGLPSFLTANSGQAPQGSFPSMVGGMNAPTGFNLQKDL